MDTDIETRVRQGPEITAIFQDYDGIDFEGLMPFGVSLFHRTDYHEDDSKSEWYGIELSEQQYSLLRSCIKNLYKKGDKR